MDEEVWYRYFVVIRRTRTGYSVDVADLPGCVSVGMTVEHARQMIDEAVTMHLEMMQQSGQPIPPPRDRLEITIDPDAGEEFYTWVEVQVPQPVPVRQTSPNRGP